MLDESRLEVVNGGDEEFGSVVWVGEDFVADGDGFDLGLRVVLGDVGLDPFVGEGGVVGGGGEELVGESDDDVYA